MKAKRTAAEFVTDSRAGEPSAWPRHCLATKVVAGDPTFGTVVMLTDAGTWIDTGSDIVRSWGYRGHVVIVAPPRTRYLGEGRSEYCWFTQSHAGEVEPASLGDALAHLEGLVLDLLDSGIATTDRLWIVGLGEGGDLARELVLYTHDRVAGIFATVDVAIPPEGFAEAALAVIPAARNAHP